MQRQYRLMRAAQSEGLFCESRIALTTVRQHPEADIQDLLKLIREELPPMPLIVPSFDPRTVSSRELLNAASELASAGAATPALASSLAVAATATATGDADETVGPISLAALDELAPAMQLSELPEALLDGLRSEERCERCAICACALLEDEAADAPLGLPIRQLNCSHAFHQICIDPARPPAIAPCARTDERRLRQRMAPCR